MRQVIVGLAALVLVVGCAGERSHRHEDNDDESVELADVPVAVRRTIEANLRGGTIDELERSTDGGRVTYDVEVESASGDFEFEVAEDGTFLGIDSEDEDEELRD